MARLTLLWMSLVTTLLATPELAADHRPGVRARHGMVVSVDRDASHVGRTILTRGGNAFDAAVAVHFALAVAAPQAGNLGGGGFLLTYEAGKQRVRALDYRETAPAGATPEMFQDARGKVVPERALSGHLAVGVPGSVRGMWALHKALGKLTWAQVLAPAIALAEEGVRLSPRVAALLPASREALSGVATSRRKFLRPDGRPFAEGERFRQPELARTLRAIAEGGADAFYRGAIARAIADDMKASGGLISLADLAGYQAVWREPLKFTYRDRTLHSMPPPSSGGLMLLGMLRQLAHYDLRGLGFGGWRSYHLMAEVMRRVYADRAQHMGDPAFHAVPLEGLTDDRYWAARRATIDPYRATPSAKVGPGDPARREPRDTTHYSVVDRWGNAVTSTTTLNGNFGSKVTVAGFLLNNAMDDFTAKAGEANQYGLVGGKANEIRPGKRMLSSMTPTLVFDAAGRLELLLGSPGGSTITTGVAQVVINVVDHQLGIQQAVDARRIHHQWLPDELWLEKGGLYSPDTLDGLRRANHQLTWHGPMGAVQSIQVVHDGDGRVLVGANDPRRGGLAAGWTERVAEPAATNR